MSQNFKAPGKVLGVTAPYDLLVGAGCKVGAIFGVAQDAATSGDVDVQIDTEGVHELVKDAGTAWAVGDRAYWDDSAKEVDTDSAAGMLIGYVTEVAESAAVLGKVKLLGCAADMLEGPQAAQVDTAAAAAATAGASTPSAAQVDTGIATAIAPLVVTINALLAKLRLAGIIDA